MPTKALTAFWGFIVRMLDAINLVLRQVGQGQNNELDESSQDASLAKQAIIRARREVLASGFHFNQNRISLAPGPDGRVPVDVVALLSVRFKEPNHSHRLDPTDGKTYVWNLGLGSTSGEGRPDWVRDVTVHDTVVVVDITNPDTAELDYHRIPELCAQWIAKRAAAEYWYEVHQAVSQTLEAKAERAKTQFQNSIPHRNIGTVTGYSALRLRGNSSPTGTFDARTQSHIF